MNEHLLGKKIRKVYRPEPLKQLAREEIIIDDKYLDEGLV